jgi:hypothetical protein
MTQSKAENFNNPDADDRTDGKATARKGAEAGAAALSDVRENVENVAKKGAAALDESGRSMLAVLQNLTDAYQQITRRNSERLSESLKELGTIKSPVELLQLQQKLMRETFENSMDDSKQIGEITLSVFTKAFEPLKKSIANAAQQGMPQR